jgi:arginine decarboxylase-like protein
MQKLTLHNCCPQALRARQLGINTVIVLEQIEELPLALEAAARLRVRPALGVRSRLATHHKCAAAGAECADVNGMRWATGMKLTGPEAARVSM